MKRFYTFDNGGRVTGKYFADWSATYYNYDERGNLTNTTTYDTILNPLESVSMTYDRSNRLARIDYPDGKFLAFTYDAAGRRTASVDQLGHELKSYYDTAGRLQSMTNELNALVVLYQYDLAGRIATQDAGQWHVHHLPIRPCRATSKHDQRAGQRNADLPLQLHLR